MTHPYLTPIVVVVLALSMVAIATPAAGSAYEPPAVVAGPVEFTALDSGDHHVELVFADAVNLSAIEIAVLDANGTVVADSSDINTGLSSWADGRVVVDLGDVDLGEGATVRIGSGDDARTYDVATTASFVQYGHANDASVEPGESLALVDLTGTDTTYEIRDGDGNVIASGTLGERSHVTVVDTSSWTDTGTYQVTFGNSSTQSVQVGEDDTSSSGSDATDDESSDDGASDDGAAESTDDGSGDADSSEGDGESDDGEETQTTRTEYLDLENETIHNDTVEVGENVTVSATFVNVGDAAGDFWAWVAYADDFEEIDRRRVAEMGIGERRAVEFTINFDEPGEYEVILSGRVLGTVTVEPATESTQSNLVCHAGPESSAHGTLALDSSGFTPADREHPRLSPLGSQSALCSGN